LRQVAGIDLGRIESRYGVDFRDRVGTLVSSGMVERDGDMVRVAAGKFSVSNEVIVELLR
jgi:hypothetical protein